MISPFTKPGTEVVYIATECPTVPGYEGAPVLDIGAIYTVVSVEPDEEHCFGFGVEVAEVPECTYSIDVFRYLDLAGLDALLTQSVINPADMEQTR